MDRQAICQRFALKVAIAQTRLETLKAKAEAAKAIGELRLIVDLAAKAYAIHRTLRELKKSGEAAYQQARVDVESRIAHLEQLVRTIEAKFKAA